MSYFITTNDDLFPTSNYKFAAGTILDAYRAYQERKDKAVDPASEAAYKALVDSVEFSADYYDAQEAWEACEAVATWKSSMTYKYCSLTMPVYVTDKIREYDAAIHGVVLFDMEDLLGYIDGDYFSMDEQDYKDAEYIIKFRADRLIMDEDIHRWTCDRRRVELDKLLDKYHVDIDDLDEDIIEQPREQWMQAIQDARCEAIGTIMRDAFRYAGFCGRALDIAMRGWEEYAYNSMEQDDEEIETEMAELAAKAYIDSANSDDCGEE